MDAALDWTLATEDLSRSESPPLRIPRFEQGDETSNLSFFGHREKSEMVQNSYSLPQMDALRPRQVFGLDKAFKDIPRVDTTKRERSRRRFSPKNSSLRGNEVDLVNFTIEAGEFVNGHFVKESETKDESQTPELSLMSDDEHTESEDGPSDFTENLVKYLTGPWEENMVTKPASYPPPPTVEDIVDEADRLDETTKSSCKTVEDKKSDNGVKVADPIEKDHGEDLHQESKEEEQTDAEKGTDEVLSIPEPDALKEEIRRLKAEAEKTRVLQESLVADMEARCRQDVMAKESQMVTMKQNYEAHQAEIERRNAQLAAEAEQSRQLHESELSDIRERHRQEMAAKDGQLSALKENVDHLQSELGREHQRRKAETERDGQLQSSRLAELEERYRQELAAKDLQIKAMKEEVERAETDAETRVRRTQMDAEAIQQRQENMVADLKERYHQELLARNSQVDALHEVVGRLQTEGEHEIQRLRAEVERTGHLQEDMVTGIEERHRWENVANNVQVTALKNDLERLRAENEKIQDDRETTAAEKQKRHHQEAQQKREQITALRDGMERLRMEFEGELEKESERYRQMVESKAGRIAALKKERELYKQQATELGRERDMMAKVLMHQWGKEEVGGGRPQGYKYKYVRR